MLGSGTARSCSSLASSPSASEAGALGQEYARRRVTCVESPYYFYMRLVVIHQGMYGFGIYVLLCKNVSEVVPNGSRPRKRASSSCSQSVVSTCFAFVILLATETLLPRPSTGAHHCTLLVCLQAPRRHDSPNTEHSPNQRHKSFIHNKTCNLQKDDMPLGKL